MSKKSDRAQAARVPKQTPPRQQPTGDTISELDEKFELLLNKVKSRLTDAILSGEITATGRLRTNPHSDFAQLSNSFAEAKLREREQEHRQRKREEEDYEERHQMPPQHRLDTLMGHYGPEAVLFHLVEILREQEDLENMLDILEPQMEMNAREGRRGRRVDFGPPRGGRRYEW